MTQPTDSIPMYSGIRDQIDHYDGLIIDLWGVIHDGVTPYPGVMDCMERLDRAGKPFAMLTNAPRLAPAIRASMIDMGIPEKFCTRIMSSGEATWQTIQSGDVTELGPLGTNCLHIGPERDLGLFDGLSLQRVSSVEEAVFIVNTGPWDDDESVADYADLLTEAAARALPMICANPDLEVIRGGTRIICAGALAAHYESLGGRVRYFGKPRSDIYNLVLPMLSLGQDARILCIGDSIHTDIQGAINAGFDSLLVTGGLMAEGLGIAPGSLPDAATLTEICRAQGAVPTGAIPGLVW